MQVFRGLHIVQCVRAGCGALTAVLIAHSAIAQPAASTATSDRDRVLTAAEEARGVRLYRAVAQGNDNVEHRGPVDLDEQLGRKARAWLAPLQAQPVVGLQLDPMGELYAVAGQDALANQQFAERLATPGLSVTDRAYTLLLAVTAFGGKASDTARMRTALDYLRQLDALPADVARWQYQAHVSIGGTYYLAGDGPAVVAHLSHAFSRVPSISFLHRQAPAGEFLQLADVLSGQNDGRRIIDSVANRLLMLFQAPSALVAIDSQYYWHGYRQTQDFKRTLQFTNYLGRPAPVVTAQYWWNTVAPDTPSPTGGGATIKRLDDGKVRLIELGSVTCMWCLVALRDLEKIHASLPANAEAWYVTRGYGSWGAQLCPPEEEASHLKKFYLTVRAHRVPIALWIGPRVADEDGGSLSQNNPMWETFGILGGPVFLVTDGRGIVRHVSSGASKALEPQVRALHFVIAEAARGIVTQIPPQTGAQTSSNNL